MRFLVVGLGSIGRRHAGNLRQLRPEARIAALRTSISGDLCSAVDEQIHSFAEVEAFGPDAAIIAGPAPYHVEMALRLVSRGVPVLVEKPLSDKLAGVDELVALSHKTGVPVFVGYNLRFDPALLHVKKMLDDDVIGDIRVVHAYAGQHLPDWRPDGDYRAGVSARRELGGGPILELSHELDYLYWFFGLPALVTCRGGKYSDLEIDVEDAVGIIMEYGRSILVSVGLDFLQRVPKRTCTISGSRGTLTWDGIKREVRLEVVERVPEVRSFAGIDRNEMYLAEIEHFLDCVETGVQPLIDVAHGRDVMAIIEAAKISMAQGGSAVPQEGKL